MQADDPREGLIQQVLLGGRELSTAAVLFHTRLANLQGLNPSDTKALDLIVRRGPLTAGELSELSGLAPASVTGLIGRLEAVGAARRVPHPDDGRKVLVEFDPQFAIDNLPRFDGLLRLLREQLDEYDDDQLRTIATYLSGAAKRQLEATQLLGGD
ncbi:MarR family transcriptional regulator [Antrihabitans sp. YC2-6]|uniref:MarR family transcriptional regulator n=1 Tax=Antrihabitans sp. YC2-6 TaxID=2799498 RepID=UPI0018F5DCF1|nr:MarR family transcriptional regulator [Antrihabitans sp. YC2-6]MBJ8346262.1 MarR family transcriptional regulator [Antrihabitans sp. YC2-6]